MGTIKPNIPRRFRSHGPVIDWPSSRAHAELGRAWLELDRPEAALSPLERAIALDPNAWAVRLMLGKAYLRLGRADEGERQLRLGREGWAKQDYGNLRPSNLGSSTTGSSKVK